MKNIENTATFSDSRSNNDLFFEISDYEASVTSGGYDFTNASKQTINVLGFDASLGTTKKYTIPPKGNQAINEPFIVYDSLIQGTKFNAYGPLQGGEDYTFTANKNEINLSAE